MDGAFVRSKPYATAAREIERRIVASGKSPTAVRVVEKVIWLLVRPSTLEGGGLGMSPESVGQLSFVQAMFFVNDFSATGVPRSNDPLAAKRAVDERYWSDPEFREWYDRKVEEAKTAAREGFRHTAKVR